MFKLIKKFKDNWGNIFERKTILEIGKKQNYIG